MNILHTVYRALHTKRKTHGFTADRRTSIIGKSTGGGLFHSRQTRPGIRQRRSGFTLIELLIVIAIIGILTAVGVGNFNTARLKARDARRKSDLQTIAKSLEAYANDHKTFPVSSSGLIVCQPPSTTCDWGDQFQDANSTVYTAKLPEEPVPTRNYVYESSDGTIFTLYAYLENENDPAIDGTITTECATGVNCNYKITSTNTE